MVGVYAYKLLKGYIYIYIYSLVGYNIRVMKILYSNVEYGNAP